MASYKVSYNPARGIIQFRHPQILIKDEKGREYGKPLKFGVGKLTAKDQGQIVDDLNKLLQAAPLLRSEAPTGLHEKAYAFYFDPMAEQAERIRQQKRDEALRPEVATAIAKQAAGEYEGSKNAAYLDIISEPEKESARCGRGVYPIQRGRRGEKLMRDTLFPQLPAEAAGAASKAEPLRGEPRLERAERQQLRFEPVSVDELVPADHVVRAVWKYVEGLRLGPLYEKILAVEGQAGRAGVDPKLLVALWLYGTISGVGSARELAELTTEHNAYRWLCGGVGESRSPPGAEVAETAALHQHAPFCGCKFTI